MLSHHCTPHLPPIPASGVLVTLVTAFKRCCLDDPRSAHCVTREFAYCQARGWAESLAWVVMPDHVHWLLQLKEGSLNACMAVFKARSERAIQMAVDTSECIWQAGYYERRLRDSQSILGMAQQILTNPLRRGLVERIDHYPYLFCAWSGPTPSPQHDGGAASWLHPP